MRFRAKIDCTFNANDVKSAMHKLSVHFAIRCLELTGDDMDIDYEPLTEYLGEIHLRPLRDMPYEKKKAAP